MRANELAMALVMVAVGLSTAQAQTSDVYSSSGGYDPFAVGGARRWYDNHTTETKDKSRGCLSLLDEAKAYQDHALALYEQARRPGNSRNQSALVRQANEQIALRTQKLKAFTDCVNQAIRGDRFASSGSKNLTRTRPSPKRKPPAPPIDYGPVPSGPATLDQAIDDCFTWKFAEYTSPDWAGLGLKGVSVKAGSPYDQAEQVFVAAAAAANKALQIDEAAYGRWQDRQLMQDYLIGWVAHCLMTRGILPDMDPRPPYEFFMATAPVPGAPARRTRRSGEYFFGYSNYPLPPFWDHVAQPGAGQ